MANLRESLREMRAQLEGIYEHLPRFGLSADRPPILDVESNDDDTSATASTSGKSSPNGSGGDGAAKERDALRQPHASGGGIPGLRILRECVRHDIEQIDKLFALHADRGVSLSTPIFSRSTNAPYLIAVWNELVRAPPPVLFIDKTFPVPSEENSSKPPQKTSSKKGAAGAKVDVVADNGRQWIRVNTIKNSRLLAEFRELDSYLTESESEGEKCSSADCACTASCRTKLAPDELDNSLLQMGKALVSAAQTSLPACSGEKTPPKVTLRLTRLLLDEESLSRLESLGLKIIGPQRCSITANPAETDARIAQTIRELLKMRLEVELGEHEFRIPPELFSTSIKVLQRLVPSRQINLDLSVLIALISDITHAPLPASAEEAYTRYIPTPAERARSRRRRQQQKEQLARAKARSEARKPSGHPKKKEKERRSVGTQEGAGNSESDDEGESVHSRALANQILREMDVGLLDEIAGRLELSSSDTTAPIEFWTSKEVRERCLRIVDKIGGPAEKRRASALFFDRCTPNEPVLGTRYASAAEAMEAYWHDSRHSRDTVPGLAPLRIFEDEGDGLMPAGSVEACTNPFWISLERACLRLLSEGATSHPRALSVSMDPTPSTDSEHSQFKDSTGEIERAAVTRGNPRLTVHTVSTLWRGAARHWTTLTANRASVREMLKESAKEAGRALSLSTGHKERDAEEVQPEHDEEGRRRTMEVAAIWVVEPRSLAESMRGDFVPA